jgi:hypothetical protein
MLRAPCSVLRAPCSMLCGPWSVVRGPWSVLQTQVLRTLRLVEYYSSLTALTKMLQQKWW